MTDDPGDTPVAAMVTVRAPVVPRIGGALGRYELGEVLGQGAMATVFRARDTRLGRQVAVKVMNLAVAARSESGERFRREAQAVAAVKHPGIVEIFDFVAASPPEPAYIVSELIEGPTLRALLDQRRGRLLPEAAALVALPLAEALAVAHARGIIHRDIKPENVMIDRGGKEARVVLTDFGVAHVTGLETMTATGALVGSPAYMSPEQARGHDVGPGSDIWALGVMLYQMATGHFPFNGRDPLMVVAAITRGLYKKPSQVSPYVSGVFDDICTRCLKLVPAERYPNAEAMAEDLRKYLRAAGLAAGSGSLRAMLEHDEQFDADVRAKVADAAVITARSCARKGEFARALAELSRATAYVPKHAEAERLFASISSRRRWMKIGAVAAGILAVGAVGVKGLPRLSEWLQRRSEAPVVAEPAGTREPAAPGIPAAPVPPAAAPVAATPPAAAETHASAAKRTRAPSMKKRERAKTTAMLASTPASEPAAPATAEPPAAASAQSPTPEPAPPPVTVPPPTPKRMIVQLLAAEFFCTPSLDGEKPRHTAQYPTREGKHTVWCTMSNGEKVPVGTLDMFQPPDGAPLRVVIKRGPNNKPILDAEKTTQPRQPDPDPAGKPPGSGSLPR
jgi:tRNA A-37 threonylcarbamoyl transferase component Bud32